MPLSSPSMCQVKSLDAFRVEPTIEPRPLFDYRDSFDPKWRRWNRSSEAILIPVCQSYPEESCKYDSEAISILGQSQPREYEICNDGSGVIPIPAQSHLRESCNYYPEAISIIAQSKQSEHRPKCCNDDSEAISIPIQLHPPERQHDPTDFQLLNAVKFRRIAPRGTPPLPPPPPPRALRCDYCRLHKIRCKTSGEGPCHNCVRKSLPCTRTPVMRAGRPKRGRPFKHQNHVTEQLPREVKDNQIDIQREHDSGGDNSSRPTNQSGETVKRSASDKRSLAFILN
ncbi:hypothetical protein OBBRIDRAFT_825129 [Obba rivulosa]|uniref:Zn(2)-C6 fungal-type domain-containing protein n=1 Tax=Obba rivulosa TaxID=1052685 RepID=A0A8E2AWN7_9APHY|nr:hypothetical protein OBBRIDRAFT_825129 [Obba rivulosa]